MSDHGPRPLCDYEIEILREVAGEKAPSAWGAAVGAALGALRGRGYIARGQITPKGRAVLAALTPTGDTDEGKNDDGKR